MLNFFKDVFNHFFDSDTFQKGTSLAYYAVFSFLPIIIIITSLLGLLFGEQAVSGEVYNQLNGVMGENASHQIQTIIKNQHTKHNSIITTIIGFGMLAFSASGMFTQIHNSLNTIWNIKAKPNNNILNFISKHIISFITLIMSFFVILLSTTISSFLTKHFENIHDTYKFLYLFEHSLSFLVMSFIFSIMFKFLGDAKIHWKAVILGGLITSLLFVFGKLAIAFYINHSHVNSIFGSASILAIILLWVYYISQIFFLGASFIKIISTKLGHEVEPNTNAVKIIKTEVKK